MSQARLEGTLWSPLDLHTEGDRVKAWELLEQKNWCQLFFAMNAKSEEEFVLADDACAWCATGAIMKVRGDVSSVYPQETTSHDIVKLANHIRKTWPEYDSLMARDVITAWNDDDRRTKEEVIKVLKELDI